MLSLHLHGLVRKNRLEDKRHLERLISPHIQNKDCIMKGGSWTLELSVLLVRTHWVLVWRYLKSWDRIVTTQQLCSFQRLSVSSAVTTLLSHRIDVKQLKEMDHTRVFECRVLFGETVGKANWSEMIFADLPLKLKWHHADRSALVSSETLDRKLLKKCVIFFNCYFQKLHCGDALQTKFRCYAPNCLVGILRQTFWIHFLLFIYFYIFLF